jgi:hypothetical protein
MILARITEKTLKNIKLITTIRIRINRLNAKDGGFDRYES